MGHANLMSRHMAPYRQEIPVQIQWPILLPYPHLTTIMRGLNAGPPGKTVISTPPTAGYPVDVAFLMSEIREK